MKVGKKRRPRDAAMLAFRQQTSVCLGRNDKALVSKQCSEGNTVG